MRRPVILYNDKGLERKLRDYGFQGPQRCTLGDFYTGTFVMFGDSFEVELEVTDAPEHGREYKRVLIHCNNKTGDCKKKSRLIKDVLQKTGIKVSMVDTKSLI